MSFATQQIELSMCSPQTGLPLAANVYTIEGVTEADGSPRLMSIGQLVMAICLQRASTLEDEIIDVMDDINENTQTLEALTFVETNLVDRVDDVVVEQHRGKVMRRDEPLVAVADAVDCLDAVVEGEDFDDALDDVVEAGAEAACREDGGAAPGRVMEDFCVRAGLLEGGRLDAARAERLDLAHVRRNVDALPLFNEERIADGRVN